MITGGLSIGILGMLGDTPSLARAAIPLSLLGVSAWQGRPRPVVAALALLAFPLPLFVLRVGSPQLESFWAAIGAALARGLGFDVVAQGPLLVSGGMRMTVDPVDGGIPIVHVLAAAAWLTAWNDSTTSARAIAMRIAVLVPLAIPIQILSMTAAGVFLATVGREAALTWLDHGAPLLAAALACAACFHRREVH